MKHLHQLFFIAVFCAVLPVFAEKNILDVEFRDLPANYEMLLKQESEKWNFNFRPYGAQAASLLWTDPIVQRDAVSGDNVGENTPTAIYAACNQEGLTILVFAAEPLFKNSLENGTALPASRLECFFAPGDADTSKIEHYYQFICGANEPTINGVYPWFVEDRGFRTIQGHLCIDSRALPNGNMLRIFVPWAPLFDRLPFSDKRDNFWRLSVIRWAPGAAQTWGGVVHAATSAGYLRFPAFTDEQKTAIRKTTLLKAWTEYQNFATSTGVSLTRATPRMEEYYQKTIAKLPQTFKNVNEDFGFRDFWLENAIKERNSLGATLAVFDSLPQSEQEAFYRNASDVLFNFSYDLEQAYARWLNRGLLSR